MKQSVAIIPLAEAQALADYIGNNIPYNIAKPLAEILQRAVVDPAFDLEAAAKRLSPK